MQWLNDYIKEIAKINAGSDATEHSYRTAIDNMLKATVAECDVAANILQEPSRIKDIGAPDFRVSAEGGGTIGYIECKKPGANLQKLTTSAQLQKYRTLSNNILLTDSWRWLLLRGGKKIKDIALTERPTKQTKADFTEMLYIFLEAEAEKITNTERLAETLARRCAILRKGLEAHESDDPTQSRLHSLLKEFRTALDTELSFAQFADTFAQTVVYSLLLAKLKASDNAPLDLYNINRHIPANFAVIRGITIFLQDLRDERYEDIAWVLDDILATINAMDVVAVTESMSYKNTNNRSKGLDDADDPYIYFYENFLAAYDAKQRERRGVYYTPPPVVKFIVRAVDDLLQRDFGLTKGLAEANAVTALDFAAGTGTFMLEMMRSVLADADPARRNMLIHEHILQNFHGFELLMAPYVIAHLKLSQFLSDNNAPLTGKKRINIFLTNTLEQISQQINLSMMPKLAEEANFAQKVKDSPVLVITGNPPYSGISQNKGEWITDLIETYKQVDGKPLGERKHWLQDDYVKFIRFAQWKMERVERGIVAIITNHGFLDNPTFRGMRQSLMNTFDTLYFLDLHGNAKKIETAPDGGKDENVFDIQQGVAISLLVKNPKAKKKGVFHADLYGKRSDKYKACIENGIEEIQWATLMPNSSPYLFVPRRSVPTEYKTAFSIKDIFSANVSGIVTARDHFAIDIDRKVLLQRMQKFIDTGKTDSEVTAELNLKDTRGWKVSQARKDMVKIESLDEYVKKITYRPFDVRWIFYHLSAVDWGREKFMHHMLAGKNLIITTVRQASAIGRGEFNAVFASTSIVDFNLNRRGGAACFPLYRYDNEMGITTKRENLSLKFRRWIDERYGNPHTPEDILGCIYAKLHSLDYRKRYADFLSIDFPRIPFPEDNTEFTRLATIGNDLIKAHLLRANFDGELGEHKGTSDSNTVEKIRYDEKEERLYFNEDEYFAPIPPQVFDFQIGGYQPLDKYLKSRKNKKLTLSETEAIRKAANAIAFTILKMQAIDQ